MFQTILLYDLKITFFRKPQFNNYGDTEVGQQIGATGAVFNNHAGGKFSA